MSEPGGPETGAERERAFHESDRPEIALITNHGYPGVDFPIGGAPDTGGQIVYVNALAQALDKLGYRVTIFARGGFPYFESERRRERPEYLSEHARYVFVPGGGDAFLRKEDIAVALDEEVLWLDAFVRREAAGRGCEPWAVYEMLNTHYWDAAEMAMLLIERWRDDLAVRFIERRLADVVPEEKLAALRDDRHWRAVGEAPSHHLGALLLDSVDPSLTLGERVRAAADRLAQATGLEKEAVETRVIRPVETAIDGAAERMAPPLVSMLASDTLGQATFSLWPGPVDALERDLRGIDRHVWTPHSLAALKQENFKDQPESVVRDLKFNERRAHERVVCERTPAFVATSTEIAERLRTHYRVGVERIFYFPPCVDPDEFHPRTWEELAPTYAYLSRGSGVPVEKLRRGLIVFETSRMDRTKRKDLILDAFARVVDERPDVYLFIGGGPKRSLFRSLLEHRDADEGLQGRAFLTGYIPDEHIAPLFALATVYISASEMEGFGMSALQAAASSAALISSDLTPFAVQYVPEHAVVVHAGDVDGFAEALSRLLSDEDERRRRIEGLRRKTAGLNWETQTRSFLRHLRKRGLVIADPGA